MKELASLHDKHLNRPTLDDSTEAEHAIEISTQEITQVTRSDFPVICFRAIHARRLAEGLCSLSDVPSLSAGSAEPTEPST